MKKLNKRQMMLYYYLEHKSEMGKWTKRRVILNDLFDIYGRPGKDLYNSRPAINLTKDVRIINESGVFDKLIISNSQKGLKIGTEEETKQTLERELIQILSKFKRYHNKVHKIGLQGQIDIEGKVRNVFMEEVN